MKRSKLISITLIMICFAAHLNAQSIKGSGNVEKQKRNVSSFNAIELNGVFNVFLLQGETEALTIEADDNLLPIIKSSVDNNKLIVKTKKHLNIKKSTKMNVFITFKDINSLGFYGVGDLSCDAPIKLKSLNIDNNGVGNLNLVGSCSNVTIKNSGVGNINTSKFTAKIMDVTNSGVGNVDIYVTEELKLKNLGIGNIYYEGGASIIDIDSSGIGKIKKK